MARIESVNIGKRSPIDNGLGRTGIYKLPQSGGVLVTSDGVEGDYVADPQHHGGADQAVYLYCSADYAFWTEALARQIRPGTFGENLTISGLASADLAIGDRLIAGDVALEVTAPRIPCGTLARRMGDPGFVKAFRDAARPGAYCRVLVEGQIAAGTPVSHHPYVGPRVGVVEMFGDTFVAKTLAPARLREVLDAPIALRERRRWEGLLAARETA